LLNRRRWRTRVELANAIFEHLGDLPQPPATPQLDRNANSDRVREGAHPRIGSG
jgi:hypothetical protein